jgi:hypothetical protein
MGFNSTPLFVYLVGVFRFDSHSAQAVEANL